MSETGQQSNGFVEWLKRRWAAIVLVVLAIVFIVQNGIATQTTRLQLLWIEVTAPLWLLALIVFLVGGLAGYLFARNRQNRRAR